MGILFCHPGTIFPGLLPGVMSGLVALTQMWWSVLMSMASATTNGPADAHEAELSLPVTMVVLLLSIHESTYVSKWIF